jgi:hypothetical protein
MIETEILRELLLELSDPDGHTFGAVYDTLERDQNQGTGNRGTSEDRVDRC